MLNYIDKKLNVITMYRLTLYCLMGFLVCAVLLGYAGLISYSPLALVLSTIYIGFLCWLTNLIFSRVFNVPTNVESLYITALILVFIITPLKSFSDFNFYSLAGWASVLAMASKYILAIKKKHIFNPVAIAVVLTAFVLGQSASWWIGTVWMVAPVLIGGFLIVRKIKRADLVLSFLIVAIITTIFSHNLGINNTLSVLQKLFFTSATFFFATIMLTEPLTTPVTKKFQIVCGTMVGLGILYLTPELALIIGNIFAYLVNPKEKLILKLIEKNEIGPNIFDFIFLPDQNFSFKPGQYMEWTIADNNSDNRGNRRYFTIASSPTESTVRIGVKSYDNMSTFKKSLTSLKIGDTIIASQRAGDFVLPKDKNKKLVFIAGGIGVTPFRSMLKYILDKNEKRDIVLFYSNKTPSEAVYKEVFDIAQQTFDTKIICTGLIDADMIRQNVPDLNQRYFYISGPHGMVSAFQKTLAEMGVKNTHIKTDFFPGFV